MSSRLAAEEEKLREQAAVDRIAENTAKNALKGHSKKRATVVEEQVVAVVEKLAEATNSHKPVA